MSKRKPDPMTVIQAIADRHSEQIQTALNYLAAYVHEAREDRKAKQPAFVPIQQCERHYVERLYNAVRNARTQLVCGVQEALRPNGYMPTSRMVELTKRALDADSILAPLVRDTERLLNGPHA